MARQSIFPDICAQVEPWLEARIAEFWRARIITTFVMPELVIGLCHITTNIGMLR
jgi:hypothetical protein